MYDIMRKMEENISYVIRRDQNADEVLNKLHTECGYHYQVTKIVEDVLNRMGINVGLMHRPYFVYPFPATVQMIEVPMGVKNFKIITKFARRGWRVNCKGSLYGQIRNLANNKNLRIKFFPTSLTEKCFYLTDLLAIERDDGESIDPESEIVKIIIKGLGLYMRRKLLNMHISDLSYLVERVRQVHIGTL
ncbi:hypothetical protein Ahy_A01g001091 [Arachis hypogaea]|uniref:Uncharacterized protein n=1 Tax=Arachis hypogaea TaxID=3818 RepID=A0A445EM18_ARAHY|nr:hypothetical protein Ahy_A01g001091 [Arachis hypogaea]